MYQHLIRPVLMRMDPEAAHRLAIQVCKLAQVAPGALALMRWTWEAGSYPDPVRVCSIDFSNKIGLAAGFDKDCEILPALEAMGFGFVEAGTITPRPQPGNPRPRIFRIPQEHAAINRMGFNNSGAIAARQRLSKLRKRVRIPIGISLGMNKDTPLGDAAWDYTKVLIEIYDYGDYVVINISSPNTPGLRELQGARYIESLIRAVVLKVHELGRSRDEEPKPVFVKISPDLTKDEVWTIVAAVRAASASGIIATNTTRERRINRFNKNAGEEGGLSGEPLFEKALRVVRWIRTFDADVPLIGVGGISTADRAKRMLDEGATLLQVYTPFIYDPFVMLALRRSICDYHPEAHAE